jgi:hypothetical protein
VSADEKPEDGGGGVGGGGNVGLEHNWGIMIEHITSTVN